MITSKITSKAQTTIDMARGHAGSRLARPAALFRVRWPAGGYGRHRDRAAIALRRAGSNGEADQRARRAPWRTFFGCWRSRGRWLGWRTRQLHPNAAQHPDPRRELIAISLDRPV